jgi:hypothetical protein
MNNLHIESLYIYLITLKLGYRASHGCMLRSWKYTISGHAASSFTPKNMSPKLILAPIPVQAPPCGLLICVLRHRTATLKAPLGQLWAYFGMIQEQSSASSLRYTHSKCYHFGATLKPFLSQAQPCGFLICDCRAKNSDAEGASWTILQYLNMIQEQ